MNGERLILFEERKEFNNNEKNDKLVEEIIERIELTPIIWEIDFERLHEYRRKKLTPLSIDSLVNTVPKSLNASKEYVFRFKVIRINNIGSYHTIPLKRETFQDLIEMLKNGSLSFDLDRERSTIEQFIK